MLRVLLGLESIIDNANETTASGNKGSILIYGQDLTAFNRVPFFSMVGQESDLFRGLNLKENVQYGEHTLLLMDQLKSSSPESQRIEEEALNNAAMDSALYPVVAKQAQGWQAAVGPRGRLLSGGERQRVSIARALYRQEMSLYSSLFPQPEAEDEQEGKSSLGGCILLMDEVTASLDAKTESAVTDAIIARVRKGATALMVAHRLSSLQKCNLILVLRDGEVVERGTHAELIRNKGWYAESWKLQSTTQ